MTSDPKWRIWSSRWSGSNPEEPYWTITSHPMPRGLARKRMALRARINLRMRHIDPDIDPDRAAAFVTKTRLVFLSGSETAVTVSILEILPVPQVPDWLVPGVPLVSYHLTPEERNEIRAANRRRRKTRR